MKDKSKQEQPSDVFCKGIIEALDKLDKINAVIDKAGLGQGADLEAYYKIKEIMEDK